ncbi:hypothetical protein [Streptococcus danieliae]|uniref:hypothetical protein n=1 Tax=Streptococcus danieliae TaxID=747656 RepID=UPI0021C66822|nr:hypothetical protein [Streptococcus danieliae]MCU0082226.1 hypothetical protein [Streptococcus danieliae]
MSNYRVKHFVYMIASDIEDNVNDFIRENKVEVLRYTLIPPTLETLPLFVGILEYEVEEND